MPWQIQGWREYVRGVYWMKMPDYAQTNFLNAERSLPDFYWTGETDMKCRREVIEATRRNAYAHPIGIVIGIFYREHSRRVWRIRGRY